SNRLGAAAVVQTWRQTDAEPQHPGSGDLKDCIETEICINKRVTNSFFRRRESVPAANEGAERTGAGAATSGRGQARREVFSVAARCRGGNSLREGVSEGAFSGSALGAHRRWQPS